MMKEIMKYRASS